MASGAWKTQTRVRERVPLVQQIDPQHISPDTVQDVAYVDTTGAPYVPAELIDGQYEQAPVPSMYVDLTPVDDHEFGVGDQPGIDQREARDLGGRARSVDMGAVSATSYAPKVARDGTYEVLRVRNHDNDGASPATVALRNETGVGVASDFAARPNTRIQRWRDRFIDMHWWDASMRPLPVTTAKVAAEMPEVANRSQWVSPFAGNQVQPGPWQEPQERRTPRSWDEGMTTDGTQQLALSEQHFGLPMWGL